MAVLPYPLPGLHVNMLLPRDTGPDPGPTHEARVYSEF